MPGMVFPGDQTSTSQRYLAGPRTWSTRPPGERTQTVETSPRSPGHARAVTVGDLRLAFTEYAGDGPALVLLHGIGSRDVSWWPVIDGLTPHFHVYSADLRGHGASSKPPQGYDLSDYAADLGALLDALGLERPRVMGHSLGALTTLTWAAGDPDRAAALVLEDPPLRTRHDALALFDEWSALAAMPLAEVIRHYQEHFPDWSAADCERRARSITGTAPGVFADGRRRWQRVLATAGEGPMPLSPDLPPTLLVAGEVALGGMMPDPDLAYFTASVPRGKAVVLPGTSHNVHRDNPAAFLAAVVPFLLAAA